MAKLKVLESAEADLVGKEIELQSEESWIGRAADAAVSIPDAAISRHHARIDQKPDGFFLVDNGSSNGTFLNEQPVTRAALKEGDRILFSDGEAQRIPRIAGQRLGRDNTIVHTLAGEET